MKLLLADRDPEELSRLREVAELLGFVTSCCTTGAAAIDRVRRERPDIAVLDTGLPDISGYLVLSFIRMNPATRATCVILLIPNATIEVILQGWTHNSDVQLVRPPDTPTFATYLRRIAVLMRESRALSGSEPSLPTHYDRVMDQKWEAFGSPPDSCPGSEIIARLLEGKDL